VHLWAAWAFFGAFLARPRPARDAHNFFSKKKILKGKRSRKKSKNFSNILQKGAA